MVRRGNHIRVALALDLTPTPACQTRVVKGFLSFQYVALRQAPKIRTLSGFVVPPLPVTIGRDPIDPVEIEIGEFIPNVGVQRGKGDSGMCDGLEE
jgi:hypothetical protein